jgi:hypothetical protein
MYFRPYTALCVLLNRAEASNHLVAARGPQSFIHDRHIVIISQVMLPLPLADFIGGIAITVARIMPHL